MSQSGQLCPALVVAVFLFAGAIPNSQLSKGFTKEWAETPIWVLSRLPMQPKTRKLPTGSLPGIASTGCVYTQPSKTSLPTYGENVHF